MIQALKKAYDSKSLQEINKSTLKALADRGYIDESGGLSVSGKNYVLSKLPLEKQCQELALDFDTIHLEFDHNPEKSLLNHFKKEGYGGCYHEGISIFTVLKALMLNELAINNFLRSRKDACSRYLEAQFVILKDKLENIILSISKTDKTTYLNNFKEIMETEFISMEYPDLSIEFAGAIFDAIDSKIFINLANKIGDDPYSLRSGWPDLTIVKGIDVQFVEVKTTDKLHLSQLNTIPLIRKILPYKFRVIKLKKTI